MSGDFVFKSPGGMCRGSEFIKLVLNFIRIPLSLVISGGVIEALIFPKF